MGEEKRESQTNDIAVTVPSSPLATILLAAAARFVDLPAVEFDQVISQTLDQLAAHLRMEHVGLSLIRQGPLQVDVQRRYVAGSNYLPSADELSVPYPWYAAQLSAGHSIILPNGPADLPPEAEAERIYLSRLDVKCTLVIPLRIGEQLLGSLYFNSTTRAYKWPDPDLHALTIFARVQAGAVQRKQTDEVLRRNEEQLGLAIDAGGVGIWSWDLAHPEQSYGSDNLSKIHGIWPCPKEQSLQIYLTTIHPDDIVAMQEVLRRCVMGEAKDFSVEHRLLWPDGSLHWVKARGYVHHDESGRPHRLTGVMQEITQRKAVEAQLEQQRLELLRQARMMEQTEHIGEIGGWEWDIAGDAFYWTPETYRIFGLSPAFYVPSLEESIAFFTPASATILRNAIRRAVNFGEAFDLKLQLTTAQGTTIWVRFSGRIDLGDTSAPGETGALGDTRDPGKITRLYGSIQNITLRTQIEEQLREAQKMDAIGQLAGGVAHDFNNLLTAINGMSELALLFMDKIVVTSESDRVRNYLGEIQRLGQRAAVLTHQLLAFSRKQILFPKLLDLRQVLSNAQELLNQLLGENIELTLVMPSHLGSVVADPSQIEQVLVNLVINARDAMPNGGDLTIRLLNLTLDEAAARRQTRLHPGAYVVLEVQDSGHGMTPEVQARLFDPFFTTKAVGEGAGLGLATVYGTVKQSGGVIDVESQPNQGSTFRIFLPQSPPEAQDAQTPPCYVRGGTETILLVEEDQWTRQSWRAALEAKGYCLLDAESGDEAISLCQSYVGPIHLLVVSEQLSEQGGQGGPGKLGGLIVANQAFLFRPDLRLLLLQNSEEDTSSQSPQFSLKKPARPDSLIAKVRSVLDTPASTAML